MNLTLISQRGKDIFVDDLQYTYHLNGENKKVQSFTGNIA